MAINENDYKASMCVITSKNSDHKSKLV